MTIDGIRCFCAVVETGNFRAAAERVHRSQPAVSQQIKRLEQQLNAQLLDRKTGKPTPAGQALYERGKRLLADVDDLAREVRDFDEAAQQELRMGASDTVALYYLPPVVRAFSRDWPQVRLVMHTRSSDIITRELADGALDLAIVTLPVTQDGLHAREVFRQKLVLIAPRRWPLGKGPRVRLRQLRDQPFVLLHEETRTGRALREHFRRNGFEPQVALNGGSFEVIKRYVAEGIGVGIVPEMALTRQERKGLTVREVAGLPAIPIGVVRRGDAHETRAARVFSAMLSEMPRDGVS